MATGFFGAIKGALFETDPEQAPSGEKTTPPTETANGAATVISDAAAPDVMIKGLTDVAMGTPSAYTRLLQAASRLESFIPDEAARFKGAISVGEDFKAADVLAAIDAVHIAAIDQQVAAFKAQAADRMAKEVDQRMQAIEATKAQVQERAQEAERLRQELAARLAEIARLDAEDNKSIAETLRDADTKRTEIEQVNARFGAAVDQVRNNLLQMREKLARYLAA